MKNEIGRALTDAGKEFGLNLDSSKVELFYKYLEFLMAENEKYNLTAIKDPEDIVRKHFLDSLSVVPFFDFSLPKKVLDVGSGGGFPGVPLKIVFPSLWICLLDSIKKKVEFLRSLSKVLELGDTFVLAGRAEELGRAPEYREGFDVVVSRAVARFNVLAELCLPFVKVGGTFIAFKGVKAVEEVGEAEDAVHVLGGKISKVVEVEFGENSEKRSLILVEKVLITPQRYPRRVGIPEKRPL